MRCDTPRARVSLGANFDCSGSWNDPYVSVSFICTRRRVVLTQFQFDARQLSALAREVCANQIVVNSMKGIN